MAMRYDGSKITRKLEASNWIDDVSIRAYLRWRRRTATIDRGFKGKVDFSIPSAVA
jgi:hypothetical protein